MTSKRSRSSGVAVSSKAAVIPPTPPPSTATLVRWRFTRVRCYSRGPGRQARDDEVFAFIKRGYELWNEGDLSAVAEMWSDDFELHTAPEWPGQRVFYGREAAIRFLTEEIAEVIAFDKIEVERIERVGNELVICMLAPPEGAESNVDIGKVPIFHVAQMRAGKVIRVRAFLDEDQAMAAARQLTAVNAC